MQLRVGKRLNYVQAKQYNNNTELEDKYIEIERDRVIKIETKTKMERLTSVRNGFSVLKSCRQFSPLSAHEWN